MTQRRIRELLRKEGPRIRERYRQVMQRVRDDHAISELETALAEGRIAEYLDSIERAAGAFASRVEALRTVVGHETADFLSQHVDKLVSYEGTHPEAVQLLRDNRQRIVGKLRQEAQDAVLDILTEGTAKGINPRQMAVKIRDVIGLTPKQAARVTAYRDRLERESMTPLNDDVPEEERKPAAPKRMTAEQIDKLVARKAARDVAVRAETIARTEAKAAVDETLHNTFQQGIDSGAVDATRIEGKWLAGQPPRTRAWHASMNGQTRTWGDPFVSGLGNSLRFPGDPQAPPEERNRCRCAVSRRVLPVDKTPTSSEAVLVTKRSPMRIMIAGAPGTGKSHLAKAMSDELQLPLIPTDDFMHLEWSACSQHVSDLIADGAPRIVEGVRVPHVLRKAIEQRPGVKPCDRLIVLTKAWRAQTPKQVAMGKAGHTVLDGVIPALLALGVTVDVRAE